MTLQGHTGAVEPTVSIPLKFGTCENILHTLDGHLHYLGRTGFLNEFKKT